MKKYLSSILITLSMMAILFSCKKDSRLKDYSLSIKEKTWWGMLTNNGQQPEYYSVDFKSDSSFKWNQLSGEYGGKWSVSGQSLTMTFPSLSVQIKGDIGDDNKLTNITDNNINSVINSGELVENPNIPLDNTLWSGTITQMGIPKSLLITFTPGQKITLMINNVSPPESGFYLRSASGGCFRVGMNAFFGVITSTGEMKGTSVVGTTSWNAKKQ